MAEETTSQGTFETRKDAGEGSGGTWKLWMTAINVASGEEEDWRKRADDAIKRYRDDEVNKGVRFNILYSSVQTQGPAMYNSTPEPDVRRRFDDDDPVGKVASQVFERSLSHCTDEYDFDSVMEAVVHDSLLPGRGCSLVVYDPIVGQTGVDYETVRTEHVQWDDFRRGPARRWEDVPWIAIRYRITRDEAVNLNPKIGPKVTLDHIEEGVQKDKKDVPDIFKRLTVWKIWDKAKRQVVFIAPSYKEGPFKIEDDLLNLAGFFPMPRPIYDIMDSSNLVPLVPYDMYKDQAAELDRITRRIHSLINVLKWRGIRPAQIEELDRLKDAEDGELIPSESFAALVMSQGARPDQAIWLMPIERLITVVRELVIQREAIKQVIFEISGLADIMRGETDPDETLGAQQLKAQWGSMRMQRRQKEVQRFARDLMRIKAEIIGEHFSAETLSAITGIVLPSVEQKQAAAFAARQVAQGGPPIPEAELAQQLPTWDEVKKVMSSDALRSFKVDIETDSTLQADMARSQQNMSNFVQGLAAFTEAMGPGVQAGLIPIEAATDLLSAFARQFKLGRKAEDALDSIGKQKPQQQQEDPAAQAQAQAVQAETQAEVQKAGAETQKIQAEAQAVQQDGQREDRRLQHDIETEGRKQQHENIRATVEAVLKEKEIEARRNVSQEGNA